LVYALINFAGTIAILKFFRYRTLSVAMQGQELNTPQFQIDNMSGKDNSEGGQE